MCCKSCTPSALLWKEIPRAGVQEYKRSGLLATSLLLLICYDPFALDLYTPIQKPWEQAVTGEIPSPPRRLAQKQRKRIQFKLKRAKWCTRHHRSHPGIKRSQLHCVHPCPLDCFTDTEVVLSDGLGPSRIGHWANTEQKDRLGLRACKQSNFQGLNWGEI